MASRSQLFTIRLLGLPIIYSRRDGAPPPAHPIAYTCHVDANSSPPLAPAVSPLNLMPNQRKKLLIHERCNHRSMTIINSWIRQGLLPLDPSVANCPDPICSACQMGKAHRRSHKSSQGSIGATSHFPGAGVSADQLEAGCPGKIPTTKGFPTSKRYRYCNIWVEYNSKYIFPIFHETKHAAEIVRSKEEFELFAARYGFD
jgi:hypothetical protein